LRDDYRTTLILFRPVFLYIFRPAG